MAQCCPWGSQRADKKEKDKCCINNGRDDLRSIGKEKDQYLIILDEISFINHFKPQINTKEGNAELVLFAQCYGLLHQ